MWNIIKKLGFNLLFLFLNDKIWNGILLIVIVLGYLIECIQRMFVTIFFFEYFKCTDIASVHNLAKFVVNN